jgi:glycyl-tRNA synthetase beta chain
MATNRLLIELGVEDLPSSYIDAAVKDFANHLSGSLKEERLIGEGVSYTCYSTPRRLTIYIEGIEKIQKGKTEDIFGPPLKSAKDKEGGWSKAALGFAKKNRLDIENLETCTDARGVEKLFCSKTLPTELAIQVMERILPKIIRNIKFPKSMRFIPFTNFRFARPLRWILALWNKNVIPIDIHGIVSDRITYGHRFLDHNQSISISEANKETYIQTLIDHHVMADSSQRRKHIISLLTEQCKKLTDSPDTEAILDKELINTVKNCIEWPALVVGSFNEKYLKIPDEVPIISMKHHQKYFPIIDKNKGLQPYFLSITNASGKPNLIKIGNERVISARLADALFFWTEDLKKPLADRYEELKTMMYQKEIGSYWNKTESTRALAKTLLKQVSLRTSEVEAIDRAIMLSKIDLITHMVYEFPELQGIMGGKYSQEAGESPEVSLAISKHYSQKATPSPVSNMVILADRLDTLQQAFCIGTKVTGSSDPYGLRRCAITIIHVLIHTGWNISIHNLAVKRFIAERLRVYAQDILSIRYDLVDAILARSTVSLNVSDTVEKMKALQDRLEKDSKFEELMLFCARISNILKQAADKQVLTGTFDVEICVKSQEKELAKKVLKLGKTQKALWDDQNYTAILENLTLLQKDVKSFFKEVMVMVEDKKIRNNRLQLLTQIEDSFKNIADFSLIVS